MMLPYTAEVLFSMMEQYNRAIWPAGPVALLLALGALVLTVRPAREADRIIGVLLAAAWIWVGAAHQLGPMATIDFAAPLYGGLWVLQGLLLAWSCVLRRRVAFRFRADAFGWTGVGLAAFALIGYPLVVRLMGYGWPALPLVGVAPNPTVVFTMGLLLLGDRAPVHLAALPLVWSAVAGVTAWLLALPVDFAVPLATVAGVGLLVLKNRRSARAGAGP